jgi:hypothetical protein
MPIQTEATIKGYFVTGAHPTQSNFTDLVDTLWTGLQFNSTTNFLNANFVSSNTQVQINLSARGSGGNSQNVPFRINAATDVPVCFCSDMSGGDSLLAVSMDSNALGSNIAGDPQYTAYFGWRDTATGNIYFDRQTTGHDNDQAYIHIGGQGDGNPNHTIIQDDYVMPFGAGSTGQVIALDGGNYTDANSNVYPTTSWTTPYSPPFTTYRALITQTGSSAPTATVLQNEMGGTVVWARSSSGVYTATLTNAFTASKTFATVQPISGVANSIVHTSASVLTITVASPGDGVLSATPVEILVYP